MHVLCKVSLNCQKLTAVWTIHLQTPSHTVTKNNLKLSARQFTCLYIYFYFTSLVSCAYLRYKDNTF